MDRLTSAKAEYGTNGTYALQNYTYNSTTGNLSTRAGVNYTYGDTNHDHAVTQMGTDSYSYDNNGNQVTRNVAGSSYSLSYDAENRLVGVTGAASATFVYDGDGNRVKATVGTTTTTYVGSYFEWTGSTSTMKKYYYAGATRVAMRTGTSTINYLLGDHLGSQAITTNSSGVKSAEVRYYPWGNTRFTSGTTPTSFKFTGQRLESAIGLYFYNARWSPGRAPGTGDSSAGRFISADTMIPDPGNTQDWDRYAYTINNPIRYTDPTGHRTCEEDGYCPDDQTTTTSTLTPNDNGPITNFLQSLPGSAEDWNTLSKGLDILALTLDSYASGVVTYGGIAGAGVAAPFIAGGAPEVPPVTGLAGASIAELSVQPLLRFDNFLASASTVSTIIADTKSGTTNIDEGILSRTTVNSFTLSMAGIALPEAYLSTTLQAFAVTNDFGLTSFPWARSLPWQAP